MTTLKDIAAKVGVDVSTVSKVLQGAPIRVTEARRDEILRVAHEMDYRPNTLARSLRLRRSQAIAIVVPSTTNFLYPEIIAGAEEAAEEQDYAMFLVKSNASDPNSRLLSVAAQGRIDGLVFTDDYPHPLVEQRLCEMGIPFVSLNRGGGEDERTVILDDEAGFRTQAEYLVELGHRSVVFVAVQPRNFVANLCLGAFRTGLSKRGVELPESRVLGCDFEGAATEVVAEQLYALVPKPTAVATASVLVASRLVQCLKNKGISVPGELSVIGYHDSPAALWPPPGVTTVRMPSREQGRRGVMRLLQLIDGQKPGREVLAASPEIVERGTCSAVY